MRKVKKSVFGISGTVLLLLVACSQVTLLEVRVFDASSRARLEGAEVSVLMKNPVAKYSRPVAPYKNTKNQFSFNNYRLGGGEQKMTYIEVTVRVPGYEAHTGSYTNLQYLDRNNRSPYQRFLDIYLKKAGK